MGVSAYKPGRGVVLKSLELLAIALFAISLASCNQLNKADINTKTKFSSKEYGVKGSPRVTVAKKTPKGGGRYQVGKPYKIRGKWYTPKEDPTYSASGKASWYGPNFHGRLTANGEIYDQYALSAAHPTLPLPSYARVTNIDNGRSIIVRVNDRGPFSKNRIIDLSSRAADMLEYKKQGVANVEVEYVGKARMDGRDEKFLMASYRDPSAKPGFWPGTGTSNTLLAMADTAKPVAGGSSVEERVDSFLLASNIPVPLPRPGRSEPGIALDVAIALASSSDAVLLSSFLARHGSYHEARSTIQALELQNSNSTGGYATSLNTEATVIRLGSFNSPEDAESAYTVASQIGPASFHVKFRNGEELFVVNLHVGADIADSVLKRVLHQGFGDSLILR